MQGVRAIHPPPERGGFSRIPLKISEIGDSFDLIFDLCNNANQRRLVLAFANKNIPLFGFYVQT
jgi:hypothetical protein